MVKSEHRFLSDLFPDHWHVLQSHLVNVLGKVSICFDRVEFGLELCVNAWVEIYLVTSCRLPFKQLVMCFSVLDFFLSSLDLFNDSFFLRKLISFFPECFTVLFDFLDCFSSNHFWDFSKIVSSKLFTTSNKVVEIILWPICETCFKQFLFKLLLFLA